MAVQFAREWEKTSKKSRLCLIARDMDKLEETKRLVLSEYSDMDVFLLQADLSSLNTVSSVADRAMQGFDPSVHKHAFLVHNAGTLGDITRPISQQHDPAPLTDMMTLHITSMWLLTAKFISTIDKAVPLLVINISSLLASVPVAGLASYSLTRAARNMFIKTLCLENDHSGFRALTYTPGACDTGMSDTIRRDVCFEKSKKMLDGMQVLSPTQSIEKLIRIVKDNAFENGAVIDYYDYE